LVDGPRLIEACEADLKGAVERMCVKMRVPRNPAEILQKIKETMRLELEPCGPLEPRLTVFQALYERKRIEDQQGDAAFPDNFESEIFDSLHRNKTSRRKARQIARGAWKEDPGADRRVRKLQLTLASNEAHRPRTIDKILSARRSRPELYDPRVVWTFADSIARSVGRKKFSVGHHGDKTITDTAKAAPMLAVLVAAVRWAMVMAWLGAGGGRPDVKVEGVLAVIKRGRPTD
jgi:hypothetical protein